MLEIAYEQLPTIPVIGDDAVRRFINRMRWAGIKSGDTCQEWAEAGAYPVKTVHVFGTWGGATLAIKGRGDLEANPLTLRADPSGVPLEFTADDTANVMEVLRYLSWELTGGDGTTNLSVVVTLGTGGD